MSVWASIRGLSNISKEDAANYGRPLTDVLAAGCVLYGIADDEVAQAYQVARMEVSAMAETDRHPGGVGNIAPVLVRPSTRDDNAAPCYDTSPAIRADCSRTIDAPPIGRYMRPPKCKPPSRTKYWLTVGGLVEAAKTRVVNRR